MGFIKKANSQESKNIYQAKKILLRFLFIICSTKNTNILMVLYFFDYFVPAFSNFQEFKKAFICV